MESHAEAEYRLRSKIDKLEKIKEGLEKEHQKLKKESFRRIERLHSELVSKKGEIQRLRERGDILRAETEELQRQFRSLETEKQSTELRLTETIMESEARRQAELQARNAVTAMARRSAARSCKRRGGDGGDDDKEEEETEADETVRKMVEPFAEALDYIERAFAGKEEEMKKLRRGLEKALSGEGGEAEEMDFVDVGALLGADGRLNLG